MPPKRKPKFTHGSKVFAKMRGYPWWPALVLGKYHESKTQLKYRIYFFGSGETGAVKQADLCPYDDNKERLGHPKKIKNFIEALNEIEEGLYPENLESLFNLDESNEKLSSTSNECSADKDELTDLDVSQSDNLDPRMKELPPTTSELTLQENNTGCIVIGEVTAPTCSSSTGYIIASYKDTKYPISLGCNKPVFASKEKEMMWNDDVYKFAMFLKKLIEEGEHIQDVDLAMMNYTRAAAANYNNPQNLSPAYDDDLTSKNSLLIKEARMIDIDLGIRSALNVNNINTEQCISLLDQLDEVPITAFMLKKHPEVEYTIRMVKDFRGSVPKSLTKPEEFQFLYNCKVIREKADNLYSKFESLFNVPNDKSFTDIFREEVRHFGERVEFMTSEELIGMVREPEEE